MGVPGVPGVQGVLVVFYMFLNGGWALHLKKGWAPIRLGRGPIPFTMDALNPKLNRARSGRGFTTPPCGACSGSPEGTPCGSRGQDSWELV